MMSVAAVVLVLLATFVAWRWNRMNADCARL